MRLALASSCPGAGFLPPRRPAGQDERWCLAGLGRPSSGRSATSVASRISASGTVTSPRPRPAASRARRRARATISHLADGRRAPAARTRARRPTKRRQCSGQRKGRSMPGEETSSTYRGPTIALDSRKRSRDRLIPAQSSAVIPGRVGCPGGPPAPAGWGAPAFRPGADRRARTRGRRCGHESVRGARRQTSGLQEKKCGGTPPHRQLARPGAPGTAAKYYRRSRAESIGSGHAEIGDHPPVRPARGAVTIEGSAIVGTAPAGSRSPG